MSTAAVWIPPVEFEEYRLVRELGRGTMGEVWLAQDTLLDRPVAIKFVSSDPEFTDRQRFLIEARAIARLSHPNVVMVHRVGQISRRPYLVSEFVRGEPLDRLPKPVAPSRILEIATGLARGLAAAHRHGVLHRDIKPANAILAEDGNVKLLDFGLAKLTGQPLDSNTSATRPLKPLWESDVADPPGTPLYMAPELWRYQPATTHSDVYALGALLYELAAGRAPYEGVSIIDLPRVVQERAPQPLRELAPDLDPELAATIDRCLSHTPTDRLADGDALREAIEQVGVARRSARTLPPGNPYRGLAAFDAEHRALFFGRGAEILAVVERLRSEPFVLVAGDSGVGKSSLCAAGVLPALREDGFEVLHVLPGRHPVRALAAAVAGNGGDEAALAEAIASDCHALGAELRRRKPIVLFVDQLEELATLAEPAAASAAAEALGALAAVRAPGVRLLATVRGDFLGRVAALPGLGEEAARGVFLLRPLGEEGLREAVIGPARAKGVRFDSDVLVSALVDAGREAGGLPLLQFALAELWERRDDQARVITSTALGALGGVGGALARHADGVVEGLPPIERLAARRILGRLITVEGTRARRKERELVPPEDAAARSALAALIAGRLLIAREADRAGEGTYELAHEALLAAWGTLRGWLDADADRRAARQRVEQAAAEWERLGRARDALLGPRRLAEADVAQIAELGPREKAFLAASRAAVRRGLATRLGALAFVPLTIALAYLGVRTHAEHALARAVAADRSTAERSLAEARTGNQKVETLRRHAFARFDANDLETAEAMWSRALDAARAVDVAYANAGRALEAAVALDPRRSDVRALLADVTFDRALLAERDGKSELQAELIGRFDASDDETRRSRLHAPAHLSIRTEPAGAAVLIEQAPASRRALGVTPLSSVTIEPGSYVFVFSAAGRAPVRLPILIGRGERIDLDVPLPTERAVPPGFVYVPPGRFLYGSDDEALRKAFFGAPPLHDVTTSAYLIARNEVTFGDWIGFLRELPPSERARRTPASEGQVGETVRAALRALADGTWQLELQPTSRMVRAREGERFHYPDRDRRSDQDWKRFPVTSISYEDAVAYAAWLDRTGRVPGARLCNDREWERAARGADGRHYPSGSALSPDDANYDVTYGRRELAFGPDEVGSHPGSRSPFGLDDTAGNAWEWTRSFDGKPEARGGSWYHGSLTCRIENRQMLALETRNPRLGLRLCADVRN